jgi:hypothetical protein
MKTLRRNFENPMVAPHSSFSGKISARLATRQGWHHRGHAGEASSCQCHYEKITLQWLPMALVIELPDSKAVVN